MSYQLRYSGTAIGKGGDLYGIAVYERDYTGSADTWEFGAPAFVQEFIPQSDNVLEPFLASTLQVKIIQTEPYNLPDTQTFDDRKYYAEFTKGSNVIFRGFLINDSISLPFTTGNQYINLSFTDGIGLLKNIELEAPLNTSPVSLNTAKLVSLLDIALICIDSLEYNTSQRLNVATSIFASGMNNRGSGTQFEPLKQSYLPLRDFLKTDGTFLSCYECLEIICKAFGAQLLQSGGEWWLVSQYERDAATLYFTKYNMSGSVISSGLRSNSVTINSYPTEPYFIDNVQNKILRKGFNKVVLNNPNNYAVNMLSNPNLIIGDGSVADYWTIDTATYTSYIVPGPADLPYYLTDITSSSLPVNTFSGVFSNTNFNVNVGDRITFSMFMTGGGGAATTLPDAIAQIIVSDGTDLYYWATNSSGDNAWVKNAGGNNVYYQIPAQSTLNGTTVNIETTGCPVSGEVTLGVYLKKSVTNLLAEFGQFSATVKSYFGQYKSISALGAVGTLSGSTITLASAYTFQEGRNLKLIVRDLDIENAIYADLTSQSGLTLNLASAPRTPYSVFIVTQDFEYQNEQEIVIGTAGISKSLKGVLMNSTGTVWTGWYRYGVTEAQGSLFDLLNIIYANQMAYNQINVEANVYSISEPITSFIFTDGTTGYNITGKRYVIGNMTYDLIANEMRGTFLEVNATDVSVARYNVYEVKRN